MLCEGGQASSKDSNQNHQKFNKNQTQNIPLRNLGISLQDDQYGPKNLITTPQNYENKQRINIGQFKTASNPNLNKIHKSNFNNTTASGVSIFKDLKNPQKTYLRNQHKMSAVSVKSTNSRFNFAIQNGKNRPNNNPFNDMASFSSNGLGQILGFINQTNQNKYNENYQSGTTSQGPQAPKKVMKAQGELQDEVVHSTPLVTGEDEVHQNEYYQQQSRENNNSFQKGSIGSDDDQLYLQNFQDKLSSRSSQNHENNKNYEMQMFNNKKEESIQKTKQKAYKSEVDLGAIINPQISDSQKQFISKIPKIRKNQTMKNHQSNKLDEDKNISQAQQQKNKSFKAPGQNQNIINNNITVTNFIIQQDNTVKKQQNENNIIKEQQPFVLDQLDFNIINEENQEESTVLSKKQSENFLQKKIQNEKIQSKKSEIPKIQAKQCNIQLQKLKQIGENKQDSIKTQNNTKNQEINNESSPTKNTSAKYNMKSSRKSQANPKLSDKIQFRKFSIMNEELSSLSKVEQKQDLKNNENQKKKQIISQIDNSHLSQEPMQPEKTSIQRNISVLEPSKLQYPLSSEDAIHHFREYLNDYELQEIQNFDGQIYYVGQNCKRKIKGYLVDKNKSAEFVQRHKERLKQMNIFNHGFDDDQGDYQVILKDHLAYRYEVLEFLGQGSFGQAIKCLDHKTQELSAVKIIRNKKKFQYQASIELRILKFLNYHDKYDQNNVIRVKDYAVFRKHLLIAFECLSVNLYEFIKNNNFQGVSLSLIRRFAIQILQALKYQKDHRIIHCDLKPENILLKQENKSGIKIIDYGSSCFIGQRIYTYIQSRFYRAPEIILGIPYTMAIDMWSFGCIIAELYTGYPIFPGESEIDQLAYIMEICGKPNRSVLDISTRKNLFFDSNNEPILTENSRGKIRLPNQKTLAQVLKINENSSNHKMSKQERDENLIFLDFLRKCFEWHPVDRMTPLEALHHDWILQGLPEKVLLHHLKMFTFPSNSQQYESKSQKKVKQREDRRILEKATISDIQGFPPNAQTKNLFEMIQEIDQEEKKREQKKKQKEDEKNHKLLKLNLNSELEQYSNKKNEKAKDQLLEKEKFQKADNQEFQQISYNQSYDNKYKQIKQLNLGSFQNENIQKIKEKEFQNNKISQAPPIIFENKNSLQGQEYNKNEKSPNKQIMKNYNNYRKSLSPPPSIDQDIDKKQSFKIISKNEQKITFFKKGTMEQNQEKIEDDEEDTIEDEFTELSKQGKSGNLKTKKDNLKQKSQMSNENVNQRMQMQSQIISQVDSESLQKTNQMMKENVHNESKDSRKLNNIESQVLKNQQIFQNQWPQQMNEVNSSSSSTPEHPSQQSSSSSMLDMSENISKAKFTQSKTLNQNQIISQSNFGSKILRKDLVAVGGVTKQINNYNSNSINLIKNFDKIKAKEEINTTQSFVIQNEKNQPPTTFQNFIDAIRGSFNTNLKPDQPVIKQQNAVLRSPSDKKKISMIQVPQNIYNSQKGEFKQKTLIIDNKFQQNQKMRSSYSQSQYRGMHFIQQNINSQTDKDDNVYKQKILQNK